jgi:hypothetical protein
MAPDGTVPASAPQLANAAIQLCPWEVCFSGLKASTPTLDGTGAMTREQ